MDFDPKVSVSYIGISRFLAKSFLKKFLQDWNNSPFLKPCIIEGQIKMMGGCVVAKRNGPRGFVAVVPSLCDAPLGVEVP